MNNKTPLIIFDFKNSLFARFFASLMLIFAAALIIITATWYTNINRLIYKNTLSHITDIIKSSDNQFEDNLKNISQCIENIAATQSTVDLCLGNLSNGTTDSFENYISGYNDLYSSNIYGIAVLNMNGARFSAGLPYIPDDYPTNEWFKEIIGKKGRCCFIFRNKFGKKDSFNCFTVGCAVMNGSTPVGAVLIDVKNSLFIKSFGTSKINGTTRTLITDTSKNIVFCNDIHLSPKQLETLINKATSEDLFNKIREIEFDGTNYIFTAQKSSYTRWTNITFFPKSLIDAEYKRALKISAFLVVVGILLTIAIAASISLLLSKRINKLICKIKNADLENLDYLIDIKEDSHDEIGLISSTLSNMASTISNQFTKIQTLSEEKRLSDIQVLKSQINPHFLYNTLNVIETLADIHHNTKICSITKSLITLLHYSVSDSDKTVTIQQEIDYIKNYLEIMQTKYLGKINVVYDVEDDLKDCLTIKMIFQPIVENCIKHALSGDANEYILIKVSRPSDYVEIKIMDNGKGISPENLLKIQNGISDSKHLGLANVNKRIKLTYGINVFSIPSVQTAVIIKIPYIKESEKE